MYSPARFQRLEPGTELLRVYITLRNKGNQPINYNPFLVVDVDRLAGIVLEANILCRV